MATSRYNKGQGQDSLAMIRETLQQVDATLSDRSHDQASDVRTWHAALYGEPPLRKGVEQWRREANEQEEHFARERAARARNMQLARASTAAVYEQRIVKVEAQLLSVVRAMSKVTENVEAELREMQNDGIEVRQPHLETKLAEALLKISQLCETVAADFRRILDLPPSPPATCEGPDDHEGNDSKHMRVPGMPGPCA
jgi:predicted RNase H-like nuclease (RuvC/YqgF family)